jgi:AcrR family transcriptional regulator
MPTQAPEQPVTVRLERVERIPLPSRGYERLRPGPGRTRDEVAADQRERLQRATVELVAESGYRSLTVRAVSRRARISSGTFYKHYRSTDECFLSTYDLVCRRVGERATEAGLAGESPHERVTLAIERLLLDVAISPDMATFILRAAPASGPVFTGTLRSSALHIGRALECCMRTGTEPPLPQPLLEGVVGGLARIGRLQQASASSEEVTVVAAGAAAWVMGVCDARESFQSPKPRTPDTGGRPTAAGGPQVDRWAAGHGDDRGMILSAAFRVARRGYHQLTVPKICREAGVPRRNFSRHFAGLEDCFSTALELRVTGLLRAWQSNRTAAHNWKGSFQRAQELIRGAIDGDLDGGRLLLIDIFAAGTQGIDRRDELITKIAQTVRDTAPPGHKPTGLEAEASTAAAWTVLAVRITSRPGLPGHGGTSQG